MSKTIYKLILLLKRNPERSVEEFRNHYETNHRKLAERTLDGIVYYARRYLNPSVESAGELPFDVITEVWFDDPVIFEMVKDVTGKDQLPPDVLADELYLFDRTKTRYATVVECESDVPGIKARAGLA